MRTYTTSNLSSIAFLRLRDIIGDPKRGILGKLPISRTSFLDGVKSGKFPKPVKLSQRTVAWPSREIDLINAALIACKSDKEIKKLVAELEAARTESVEQRAAPITIGLGGEAVKR
ncbi:AlpA family phage regulatory protein [Methylomicrobium sp. Wu6]|uniref:helix-turn-helix transcriptional regulator n=1 Tax=Methylomicrobium sp. Wu6 TaxID=3107928 RepID=UPI002DD6379C|nr:AlpA family phage regulatory protein [Methylomicrobium sp. Wu6]MEC4747175.1 AlpA family phage regulatory protein [Methylomicrobium sp. Wu6]